MIRILYVDRPTGIERNTSINVSAGVPIGIAADLQTRGYSPAVTPHIHLQIKSGRIWIDPTPFFFGL